MATTGRIGIVLVSVLLIWAVIYYSLVAPVIAVNNSDSSGIILEPTDTIGSLTTSTPTDTPLQDQDHADTSTNPETTHTELAIPVGDTQGVSDPVDESDEQDSPDDGNVHEDGTSSGEDEIELPSPPPTTPYTVQNDDTMETIAKDWFGQYSKWVLIAQENPFVDPRKLRVGQVLRLPARDSRLEDIPQDVLDEYLKEVRYVVSSGDTLSGIASKFYGKASLYRLIYDANRNILRSENDLQLGMELIIPPHQQPAD